jgi:DNA-directed RNA polymerase I, II, and III subunit RPABC2
MDDEDYNPADEAVEEDSDDESVNQTARKRATDASRVNATADDNADETEDDDDDDDDEEEDMDDNDLISETSETDILARLQPGNDATNFADTDDESDAGEDNGYLQKFDAATRQNILAEFHPELQSHNYDEIANMCVIVRDANGTPIDQLHRTIPILTRYEKARVLGERAKQLNSGAKPFVKIDDTVIDGYLIALKELEEKKMPFIIKRPMPNGGCEYWRLSDLEILI